MGFTIELSGVYKTLRSLEFWEAFHIRFHRCIFVISESMHCVVKSFDDIQCMSLGVWFNVYGNV
ncbi:hypothetical protein Pan258_02330 [Symmachiella dynata]|nr:hypothetical protein Pan258_02330 [Symmachiella dynata]